MAFYFHTKKLWKSSAKLIKIQLTFVQKKKEPETLPEEGSLAMSWPHGQGQSSTQTKSN